MSTYSTDRRSLLRIIGSIGATCAFPFASEDLYGQKPEHVHAEATAAGASRLAHFLNESDFKTISRIADLIIPETDTPGAIGAGVPDYIDSLLARNTDHQLVIADGLRWLATQGGKPFIELSEQQQLAILEPLCAAYDANPENRARNVQFFGLIKNLTADGYYTSRVGLMDELRYQGNKILTSYPACP